MKTVLMDVIRSDAGPRGMNRMNWENRFANEFFDGMGEGDNAFAAIVHTNEDGGEDAYIMNISNCGKSVVPITNEMDNGGSLLDILMAYAKAVDYRSFYEIV